MRRISMSKNLIDTILKAVATALGVAVLVLNLLGALDTRTALTLLGIVLTALALAELRKTELSA